MKYIKFLWRNIYARIRLYKIYKEFREKWATFYQETLAVGKENPSYSNAINYLMENGATFYPFKSSIWGTIPSIIKYPIFWDSEENMYMYIDQKKIYCSFPTYISLISEQSKESAHRYFSDSFHIVDGDIFVDVGAAERMITLQHIDKIAKAYLIESDVNWKNALEKTFAPYSNKTRIIYKTVSNIDDDSTITLDKLLENESGSIIIKMDVEGYEMKVLEGCKNLLKRDNVKFVVCTYHNDTDAEDFKKFFSLHGYHTEFSNGYLWVPFLANHAPYLNKGIIRAWK